MNILTEDQQKLIERSKELSEKDDLMHMANLKPLLEIITRQQKALAMCKELLSVRCYNQGDHDVCVSEIQKTLDGVR